MESNRKTADGDSRRNMIRALIVDDEMGAINTLRGMLQQYCPQVNIVEASSSVRHAVLAVRQYHPDLVFLDIEMPPVGSGFDVLKDVQEFRFGVIFTTAYPKYAIQAINSVQPWAYLVKPYSVAELKAAVQTAEEKMREQHRGDLQKAVLQRLIIQDSRKGTLVIPAGDIVYCKADGSFTHIYILKNLVLEKITSSRHLGELESELPELLFCRTHHSFLLNLLFVERFERTGRNGMIHLSCTNAQVDVSVAKMDHVATRLEDFGQYKELPK